MNHYLVNITGYLYVCRDLWQNERPPIADNCQPALASLIRHCWCANPSKRPDFSEIVTILEKFDECAKDGQPLPAPSSGLVSRRLILGRFKGCIPLSSSIPVYA
ncbi:hypothetical protein ACHQM5_007233 [Ranunculus cassubicifolius]